MEKKQHENLSWKDASPEDKALLLGESFRDIEVIDFLIKEDMIYTHVILDGKEVVLVGNPEEALKNYFSEGPV